MGQVNPVVFREYDVRGVAGTDFYYDIFTDSSTRKKEISEQRRIRTPACARQA